jgi:hypothetical protein
MALDYPQRVVLLDESRARWMAQAAGPTAGETLRVLLEAKCQHVDVGGDAPTHISVGWGKSVATSENLIVGYHLWCTDAFQYFDYSRTK